MSISISLLSPPQLPNFRTNARLHCRHPPPTRTHPLIFSSPPNFFPLSFSPRRNLQFVVGDGSGKPDPESSISREAEEARGQSTLPDRFKPLLKEVPDRPLRWPWLLVPVVLVYAWRTVAWELTNWKKALLAIASFLAYLLKLALAFVFHFIGDPVTGLIRYVESFLYLIQSVYSSIVAYAPVQELTTVIVLSSVVLSIAEAAVPGSVNSQPYLLSIAGLLGFWAVVGSIPAFLLWLLLLGMFCFSRFVKNRDNISAILPLAAAAAAVGEPWVRILALASFISLAIIQQSKSSKEHADAEVPAGSRSPPLPLLFVALAIGIHVAAKWLRYRHLTWMIV